MEAVPLTTEMMVVLGLLGFTVFLFVSEIVRVDLAAVLVMVLLGGLSYLPGLGNLADITHLFDGFASNAVVSIIAVMIIGAGLDRTGLMSRVAAWILKVGGKTESRIVPIVSGTVAIISSFMQNVGAAALFLPVVSRISARTELPLSRMLMPMGFCAILGGTMTMVGSSPLILLNDLVETANGGLAADQQIESFELFSVAPIGIALTLTGILYFVVFGRFVLPSARGSDQSTSGRSVSEYFKRIYGIKTDLFEVELPKGSILNGHTLDDIMAAHQLYIVGTYYNGLRVVAPTVLTEIKTPCRLAMLGRRQEVVDFAESYGLDLKREPQIFAEEFAPTQAGVGEIVVKPGSGVIGHSASDLGFRRTYGMNLLAIHRGDETISIIEREDEGTDMERIGRTPLHAGDTLVVHGQWERLSRLKRNADFVVVTSDFPEDDLRPKKVGWALAFFLLALGLILFTDVRLSLCLMAGAVGMILTRVLSMDEAYRAIGWNSVFLLASLIPLGEAVQSSGTAAWIADQILRLLDGWPIWGLQAGVAVLATVFSLVMSNVGATVLLVPLAVSIAVTAGGNPAIFALTVAISTSNSFLIPTHQVNALIMGPAGYRVVDFLRAGGIMTVLYLAVSLTVMNLIY